MAHPLPVRHCYHPLSPPSSHVLSPRAKQPSLSGSNPPPSPPTTHRDRSATPVSQSEPLRRSSLPISAAPSSHPLPWCRRSSLPISAAPLTSLPRSQMESSRSAPRPDSPRISTVIELELGHGGGRLLLHNLVQGEEAAASSGVCFFSGRRRHGARQGALSSLFTSSCVYLYSIWSSDSDFSHKRMVVVLCSCSRSCSSLSAAAGGLDWIGFYLLYYLFENLRCGPPNLRPQKEDLRVEKGHLNVIWRKELSRNQNVIILLFCRGESKDYLFLFMLADRV